MTALEPSAFDFRPVLPALLAIGGACAVLLCDAFFAARFRRGTAPPLSDSRLGIVLAAIATLSLGFAIWSAVVLFGEGAVVSLRADHPMLRLDRFSSLGTAILGLGALLCVWLSITYLQALRINRGEYYALLLLSVSGMFITVSAVDLMAVYLGLELSSLPLYALAGFDGRKLRSSEAGLKYFLSGAFASAVAVYGMALLYGATGETEFTALRQAFDPANPLGMMGLALLLAGFLFKLSAPPFHLWAPDVYEGAPAPVTAFLSVSATAAAFLLLLRFLALGAPDLGSKLEWMFGVLAVGAMVVGTSMALLQSRVKRMLAFSSIAHMGFLLIALVSGTSEAYAAALFYLFVSIFMNLGAFAVVVTLAQGGHESGSSENYVGLARNHPGLSAAMVLFMLALSGMPGTAGFSARLALFSAAVKADQVVLVIIALAASGVSLAFYLRLPVVMFMRQSEEPRSAELSSNEFAVLLICAAAVLYYGFVFDLTFFEQAVEALR